MAVLEAYALASLLSAALLAGPSAAAIPLRMQIVHLVSFRFAKAATCRTLHVVAVTVFIFAVLAM
eukprot:12782-Alexandrium_andersonii.AAC.1